MHHLSAKLTKERPAVLLSLLIILLYLSPLFLLGENAHLRVHDNMDSNIAWYKVLARSHELFGPLDAMIPQVMNGVPRGAFGTEFSGIVWLHSLFPSMIAYALSQTITRVAAFFGMYLLLRKHFIKGPEVTLIRAGVALAFALTPFWPSGMLSTLGQPLALWAFLNIRKREISWREITVLLLLPFYSSFVLGFFFFLTGMGVIWLRDLIKKRDWNPAFIGSIALMTGVYLAIEYRLLHGLVFTEAPTSRSDFFQSTIGLGRTLYLAFINFVWGHMHVLTMHILVILPILFIALRVVFVQKSRKANKLFIYLLGLNMLLSLWYAFWFYKGWQPLKEKFTILTTFDFGRFHFLHPLVIYLSFALGLLILWRTGEKWQKRVLIALVAQVLFLFVCNDEVVYRVYGEPSFKQFFAVDQFQQIKEYIGKPQQDYRVASIGLNPSIAQYNGFYTLDSYINYYPLAYKYQFRQIIAKELDKNPTIESYFDHWGNRCFLFVSELGKNYEYKKDSGKEIRQLELNTDAFKAMGGQYIFSAVPIRNADEDGLRLLKAFDSSESAWRVYLYQAK